MNLSAALNPALSASVEQKLVQTLSQWRQWRTDLALSTEPERLEVLGCGKSNISILVAGEDSQGVERKYVVRIDGNNPAALGLSRSTEWRALERGFAANIAPQPVYFNPEIGALVCAYLEPDPDTEPDPNTSHVSAAAQQIGELLRTIHTLPDVHHRLDLQARAERYEKRVESCGHELYPALKALKPNLEAHFRAATLNHQIVFCHNDLLSDNRILTKGVLRAIDWEYCAMGPAWYDLAVVIHGDDFKAASTAQLLEAYLGYAPAAEDYQALHHFGCVYRYLELLWYMLQSEPTVDKVWLEQRFTELKSLV